MWYAKKGEYLMAVLSLISVIPVVGDIIGKGTKGAIWLAKGAKAAKSAGTGGRAVAKGIAKGRRAITTVSPKITKAKKAIAANRQVINGVLDKAEQNEKLAPHVAGMRQALDEFQGQEEEEEEQQSTPDLTPQTPGKGPLPA